MGRTFLLVLVAAALGSLAGTVGMCVAMGGTGAAEPGRFIIGFSIGTMIFTLPGTIMLVGLQAILAERGLSRRHADALVVLFGALAGAIILGFISPHVAAVGAL